MIRPITARLPVGAADTSVQALLNVQSTTIGTWPYIHCILRKLHRSIDWRRSKNSSDGLARWWTNTSKPIHHPSRSTIISIITYIIIPARFVCLLEGGAAEACACSIHTNHHPSIHPSIHASLLPAALTQVTRRRPNKSVSQFVYWP